MFRHSQIVFFLRLEESAPRNFFKLIVQFPLQVPKIIKLKKLNRRSE